MRSTAQRLAALCLSVALAVAFGAPRSADATTMVFADVEQLTEWSDIVVVGQIADARVYRGEMGHITTDWTVVVEDTWKGEAADTLVFSQWAGTLDGETHRVPGDPEFRTGERVVLFLHIGEEDGVVALTAMSQSVFRLEPQLTFEVPGADALTPVTPTIAGTPQVLSLDDVVVAPPTAPLPARAEWTATRHFTDLGFYNDANGEVVDLDDAESMSLPTLRARVQTALATEGE